MIFAPRNTYIQHKFKSKSLAQIERRNAVKREFMHAWTGYQDHAWMADGLMSLSGSRKNQFCGWSATLVDALDTLYIMGFETEFEEALNATLTIDFGRNGQQCEVNLFESTIRYLGGMLAAYDLSRDARLLPKLIELGDLLLTAFQTSNGMPCLHCKLATEGVVVESGPSPLADVGSLYLEFARLAQVTEDERYMSIVDSLSQIFARAQNQSSIPGLWPEWILANSTDGEDAQVARYSNRYGLGALSDSTYEYLVKTHLLLGRTTTIYKTMWKSASTKIKQHILFRPFLPSLNGTNIILPGIVTKESEQNATLETRTEHLACFSGGMFAMAARIFNEPDHFSIGEQITKGCVWAYNNSVTGIMPETFTAVPCITDDGGQCEWDGLKWQAETHPLQQTCVTSNCNSNHPFPPGFLAVKDASYKLRPEAIESVFIMWRLSGDEKWRDIGWTMFESIITHTRSPFGHAALLSTMEVFDQDRYEKGLMVRKVLARQQDDMESFWFAETLKYFYLLFSEPGLISLDEWVLNTEAHPFRLRKGIRGFG
jgi:mannosyl-oligosaccharide alpha-1,2-mannosidase